MPNRESRSPRSWMRDRFLFTVMLASLAVVTIALAVTGRVLGDLALIGLAVVSTVPAFWLFYQRQRVMSSNGRNDRLSRR